MNREDLYKHNPDMGPPTYHKYNDVTKKYESWGDRVAQALGEVVLDHQDTIWKVLSGMTRTVLAIVPNKWIASVAAQVFNRLYDEDKDNALRMLNEFNDVINLDLDNSPADRAKLEAELVKGPKFINIELIKAIQQFARNTRDKTIPMTKAYKEMA